MLNIAIDGHVGSGKSTLAKGIAKNLGLKVLDTGAIYRGLACAFKEGEWCDINLENVTKFASQTTVKIAFIEDLQHVIVNGKDYTPWLRLEETSRIASQIAVFQVVRNKVLEIQRDFANNYDCVMEGRDIGTDVLPNAQLKLFITASEEVRAKRRFDQIKDKTQTSFEQVLKDLRDRDYKDTHREIAPLKPAKDAIIIDTSDMTLEQTIEKCVDLIKNNHINIKKC